MSSRHERLERLIKSLSPEMIDFLDLLCENTAKIRGRFSGKIYDVLLYDQPSRKLYTIGSVEDIDFTVKPGRKSYHLPPDGGRRKTIGAEINLNIKCIKALEKNKNGKSD